MHATFGSGQECVPRDERPHRVQLVVLEQEDRARRHVAPRHAETPHEHAHGGFRRVVGRHGVVHDLPVQELRAELGGDARLGVRTLGLNRKLHAS